ncbi:hypothetical protein AB0H12_04245 [Actinosynnema sp. NPDC023794]
MALVFLTGLVINAASEHLPKWMTISWVVRPVLVAVLGVTLVAVRWLSGRTTPVRPSTSATWASC